MNGLEEEYIQWYLLLWDSRLALYIVTWANNIVQDARRLVSLVSFVLIFLLYSVWVLLFVPSLYKKWLDINY